MTSPTGRNGAGADKSARETQITKKLLDWYDQNKRALPWRFSSDPYHIWVSEIMAQQTRISALLPYYERFIRQFPTLEALAAAGEDDVLKAWEGLGYYSRARNLRKAAVRVVRDHGGNLPDSVPELLKLPGIGPYTAGAILSIAFQKPVPAVDGNVLRVCARLENDPSDVSLPAARKAAERFAARLIPGDRPGCFTQSLMELGALVCLIRNPVCGECPLAGLCGAYAAGTEKDLPVKSAPKPKKHLSKTVLIIEDALGMILVRQRAEKLLHGLWEFDVSDSPLDETQVFARLRSMGFSVSGIRPLGESEHTFTHMVWHMTGFHCRVREGHAPDGSLFLEKAELKRLAFPAALRFYTRTLR